MFRSPHPLHLGAAALALAVTLGIPSARAECRPVHGAYVERFAPEGCTSRFGVCVRGEYTGVLQGSFHTTVEDFLPLQVAPPAPVALFSAVSTLQVRIGSREGTLWVRNAGALRTAGDGEIVDVQSIVAGSGGLASATGVMTAVGRFSFADGGQSTVTGTVCIDGAF